jgi:hypothetical protein
MAITSTLENLAQIEVDFNEVEPGSRLFALLDHLHFVPDAGDWVQLYDDSGNMALGEIIEVCQDRGFLVARMEPSTFQDAGSRFFAEIPDALRPRTSMPMHA